MQGQAVYEYYDCQCTSSSVYVSTQLHSINKEADTSCVSRPLSVLEPPRRGFWGLVIPHYLDGLRSPPPNGCSRCSKSFTPPSLALLQLQVNAEARERYQCLGLLATIAISCGLSQADRALKRSGPWDYERLRPLNALAPQYSVSCLVSRLQLVSLNTVSCFFQAAINGDPLSAPIVGQDYWR